MYNVNSWRHRLWNIVSWGGGGEGGLCSGRNPTNAWVNNLSRLIRQIACISFSSLSLCLSIPTRYKWSWYAVCVCVGSIFFFFFSNGLTSTETTYGLSWGVGVGYLWVAHHKPLHQWPPLANTGKTDCSHRNSRYEVILALSVVVGNTKTVHRENQLLKPETKDCPTRYMRAQLHLPVQTAPGLRLFSFSFDVGGGQRLFVETKSAVAGKVWCTAWWWIDA